jgi:hypothetical protein
VGLRSSRGTEKLAGHFQWLGCQKLTIKIACAQGTFGAAARYPLRSSLGLWYNVMVFNSEGGPRVDIALRMNVLAVCAAFAFVGAILLGAF